MKLSSSCPVFQREAALKRHSAVRGKKKKKKREAIDGGRMLGRMTAFQLKKKKKKKDVAIKSGFGRSSWKIAGDRNVIFQVQQKKKKPRKRSKPPPHPLDRFQSLFLCQWFDARGDRLKERDCLGLLNILSCRSPTLHRIMLECLGGCRAPLRRSAQIGAACACVPCLMECKDRSGGEVGL